MNEAHDSQTDEDRSVNPEDPSVDSEDRSAKSAGHTADAEDGSVDPEDGSADPEDGSADPEDGSADPEDRTTDPLESGLEELTALRSLIMGEEQTRITEIQERLENPELRAEDVSRVLAEAVIIRMGKDDRLSKVLTPTIEDSFQVSIHRNPKVLVDSIAPLMGPAIRRAIFQAISGMVESLNQTLEHSLSPNGLKWRWEAWRTGKPFAEVVLLHTLVYQVEQVFLIHRETGLLLQHVVAQAVQAMDADMVSGMLTAIQDFVQDSFGGNEEDTLQTFQVGERVVWIEQGPNAVLAGVIRGSGPSRLRTVFQEALENIHLEQKEALQNFTGDASVFDASRMHLEDCLQSQFRAEEAEQKKQSPLAWILIGAIVLTLGTWGFFHIRSSRRRGDYLERLDTQAGITVTQSGEKDGRFFVAGLRDPLAADPWKLLEGTGLRREDITGEWEPFLSFRPELTLQRIRQSLSPPPEAELELIDGVLHISGAAPHEWIAPAMRRAEVVPGVRAVDASRLDDADLVLMQALERQVEDQVIYFGLESVKLEAEAWERLRELAGVVAQLAETAERVGMDIRLLVTGYTDASGTETLNLMLSQERAETVVRFLGEQGVPAELLRATGMGSQKMGDATAGEPAQEPARRVVFSVVASQ